MEDDFWDDAPLKHIRVAAIASSILIALYFFKELGFSDAAGAGRAGLSAAGFLFMFVGVLTVFLGLVRKVCFFLDFPKEKQKPE